MSVSRRRDAAGNVGSGVIRNAEGVDWLNAALTHDATDGVVNVDGIRIAYRVWDSPTADSTILLVHGGAAHLRWWDPIAPLLTASDRVVALDLSGHGDSAWRPEYSLETWSREVSAVAAEAAVGAVTLVGHSLGGLVATRIATGPPGGIVGAVVIDAPIDDDGEGSLESPLFASHRHRLYPTLEEGVRAFHPIPGQSAEPVIATHIARLSLHEVEGGWTWKYDPRLFAAGRSLRASPRGARVPYAYVRAENGLIPPSVRGIVESAGGIHVELPAAGHAPMLDQPLALTTAVSAIAAGWRRSPPDPR